MINKEHLEKMLKKNEKVAVYLPDNTQCTVRRIPEIHLVQEGQKPIKFSMDCKDLSSFCQAIGLSFVPTTKN